jgi:hypothetical protein
MWIKRQLKRVLVAKGTVALMNGTLVNYEHKKFKAEFGCEGPEVKRTDQREVQAELVGDADFHQDGDDGRSYGPGEHGV